MTRVECSCLGDDSSHLVRLDQCFSICVPRDIVKCAAMIFDK